MIKGLFIKVLMIALIVFPNLATAKSECGLGCKAVIGYIIYKSVTKENKQTTKDTQNSSSSYEDYYCLEDREYCEE